MKNDGIYALSLIGVFLAVSASGARFPVILDLLSALTRPGATVLLLGSVWFLYHKGLVATALIFGILVVYMLKTLWVAWPASDARRLHLEVGRDLARFDPSTSIDLQFANGTAKHDLPHLIQKTEFEELLVFPPSSQTLHDMNG
jgi:hypothetical protein